MSLRRTDGFSLVEVIIALALLGAVLISISGLYVLGTRQVESGRAHSTALSVARDIVERMNGWSFHQTYWAFGSSYNGESESYTIQSIDPEYIAEWLPALEGLNQGKTEILIESVKVPGGPDPLLLKNALQIRIVVTVEWYEGSRPRSVQLATVRM